MAEPPRSRDAHASTEPLVLRVAALVLAVRDALEEAYPTVWVEGDVIESRRASTGHLYFTLADPPDTRGPSAQLKCIVFASDRARLECDIAVGTRVRVRGRVSVFPAQSSLQLIVTHAIAAGLGDRAERLAKLKEKLRKEGLFDTKRKRALPRVPRVVGVVTSKHGAAFHDVVTVASHRFPVRIILAHCTVQGPDAARSIVAGLDALSRFAGLDVVIVTRGGGASEDLSAFDDERVVRAIAAFPVPIVSGVGHETDVTLADLAADVRAATPSNAAEIVVPDREALRGELDLVLRRLQGRFDARVQSARLALGQVTARLASRRGVLRARREGLRGSERTLERALRRRLERDRKQLATLTERLGRSDPRSAIARARGDLARLSPRLEAAIRTTLTEGASSSATADGRLRVAIATQARRARHDLAIVSARMNALSPLAVLARGYAIALDPEGRAITNAGSVSIGDIVEVRVDHGRINARVERVHDETER